MASSTPPTTLGNDETLCCSSVDTIRGFPPDLSITISDLSDIGRPKTPPPEASHPPSPHSSSWPSPSSPSGDSVSSFPSVSSSFLFSSNPDTPPHIDLELATHHTTTSFPDAEDPHGLIIPSLTLPSPLKRPTQHGKSIGDVKILVLSNSGRSSREVLNVLADEDCEDYVDVGHWEEHDLDYSSREVLPHENSKVLRLSTDWLEHHDAHGLEKYEAVKNIELVHLPEYVADCDPMDVVRSALRVIHTPFHALHALFKSDYPPNNLLASLLSAPTSPLYTALILSLESTPSQYEQTLIKELSPHIPIIVLPPLAQPGASSHHAQLSKTYRPPQISSVCPSTPLDFRTTVLRSPETLSTLRLEAADRFLRWREVERSVEVALSAVPETRDTEKVLRDWKRQSDAPHPEMKPLASLRWDKAKWEAKWEGSLSADVSKTLRQRRNQMKSHEARKTLGRRMTVTAKTRPVISASPRFTPPISSPSPLPLSDSNASQDQSRCTSIHGGTYVRDHCAPDLSSIPFDPLHLPSLVAFSFSLLTPLRTRISNIFTVPSISPSTISTHKEAGFSVGFFLGAFCAGLGVGFVIAKFRI